MMKNLFRILDKSSVVKTSFTLATLQFTYILLVAVLIINGSKIFSDGPNYLGPVLFLILFSASVLISAILTLAYPVVVFWERKMTYKAIKLVLYEVFWLLFYIAIVLILLATV